MILLLNILAQYRNIREIYAPLIPAEKQLPDNIHIDTGKENRSIQHGICVTPQTLQDPLGMNTVVKELVHFVRRCNYPETSQDVVNAFRCRLILRFTGINVDQAQARIIRDGIDYLKTNYDENFKKT